MNKQSVILSGIIYVVCTSSVGAQIQSPIPSVVEEKPSQEVYIKMNGITDAKTPREQILNTELAMPGVGFAASKAALQKRMMYAAENDWLTQNQLDELTNDLKNEIDKENSLRDESGNLSVNAKRTLASEIFKLNEKFENFVLNREIQAPGKDGLADREKFLKTKIKEGVSSGVLSKRRAEPLKNSLAKLQAETMAQGLTKEQMKDLSARLQTLGNEIDKAIGQTSVAATGPFSIR